jgi:thioredoxin 2
MSMQRSCKSCGAENRIPERMLDKRARCGACKAPLAPEDAPVEVTDVAAFEALVGDSPLPVLVDFWAPWCGPCRVVAPELEKLAKVKAGKAVVAKVNTDLVPVVAARFGIQAIPTLVLFRGGKEAKRVSGAMAAPAIEQAFGL